MLWQFIYCSPCQLSTGYMVADLSKIPKPAKEPKKATLAMMDGDDTLDLFDAKSVKGWWTMVEELEDGTRKVQVGCLR